MNTQTQKETGEGNAPRKWKDTPRSTAEQIEISLRTDNSEKQVRLDSIIANCNFILANSDNAQAKLFASTILGLAKGEGQ